MYVSVHTCMCAFNCLSCCTVTFMRSCFQTGRMILHFSLPPLPSLAEVDVVSASSALVSESAWCLPSLSQVSLTLTPLFFVASSSHRHYWFGIIKEIWSENKYCFINLHRYPYELFSCRWLMPSFFSCNLCHRLVEVIQKETVTSTQPNIFYVDVSICQRPSSEEACSVLPVLATIEMPHHISIVARTGRRHEQASSDEGLWQIETST